MLQYLECSKSYYTAYVALSYVIRCVKVGVKGVWVQWVVQRMDGASFLATYLLQMELTVLQQTVTSPDLMTIYQHCHFSSLLFILSAEKEANNNINSYLITMNRLLYHSSSNSFKFSIFFFVFLGVGMSFVQIQPNLLLVLQ